MSSDWKLLIGLIVWACGTVVCAGLLIAQGYAFDRRLRRLYTANDLIVERRRTLVFAWGWSMAAWPIGIPLLLLVDGFGASGWRVRYPKIAAERDQDSNG